MRAFLAFLVAGCRGMGLTLVKREKGKGKREGVRFPAYRKFPGTG
jgi:hypothetical protein